MKTRIHAIAGMIGLALISIFFVSTVVSEIFGSAETVARVKCAIVVGLVLLVPCMAIAGATGNSLAKGSGDVALVRKKKRMMVIAANGLLVLVPSAVFLAIRANADLFDWSFYAVQAVELLAGAVNILLMSLNAVDGMRITGRLKQ